MTNLKNFLSHSLDLLRHVPKTQVAALDGLRSLAILLVIAQHSTQEFSKMGGAPNFLSNFRLFTSGWIGVDLFFILSGFFIGKQIWQEVERTGKINFVNFFFRRGLRIWPLYFSVLFLTIFCFIIARAAMPPIWPEAFFLSNYFSVNYIGGSWSLATEEQFYIAVPLIVLSLCFFTRSLQKMRWVLLLFLCLEPVIRVFEWWRLAGLNLPESELIFQKFYQPFHTHADGLIFGLLISNIIVDKTAKSACSRFSPWLVLLLLTVIGALLRKLDQAIFEYSCLAFFFGGLAWLCLISTKKNWIVKLFSWRGFYLISRLSFGMYLMHQFAMAFILGHVLTWLPKVPAALQFAIFGSGNLCIAMLSAAIGFILIEQPFLRLRGKLGYGAPH